MSHRYKPLDLISYDNVSFEVLTAVAEEIGRLDCNAL
jgi:hypothetical protein